MVFSYERAFALAIGIGLLTKGAYAMSTAGLTAAPQEVFGIGMALIYLVEALRRGPPIEGAGKVAFHLTAATGALFSIFHGCANCPDLGYYFAERKPELALYVGMLVEAVRTTWKRHEAPRQPEGVK